MRVQRYCGSAGRKFVSTALRISPIRQSHSTLRHRSKEFRIPKSRAQGKDRRRFCSIACANRVSAMLPQEQTATTKKTPKEIKLLAKNKSPKTAQELTALRHALDINQRSFWACLGVTQSGGSRYEQGRPLPPPLRSCWMRFISTAFCWDAWNPTTLRFLNS